MMEKQEFLEAGWLESYALGLTTPSEKEMVTDMLGRYPELQVELEQIEHLLECYAAANAIAPAPYLRERLLALFRQGSGAESVRPPATVRWRGWLAAALMVLAASLGLNFWLANRYRTAQQTVARLEAQNTSIAENLRVQQAAFSTGQQEIALLKNPAVRHVELAAAVPGTPAQAHVYWDTRTQAVYLSDLQLPHVPSGRQYQLWAIGKTGKPTDAGVFNPGEGLIRAKNVGEATAFAISLEAAGGSTTAAGPKGTIYAMGKVG